MNTLHTDRLILRPLGPADAYAYATVRYHPAVARWLPPAPADDPLGAARATVEHFAEAWKRDGYGPWGLFLRRKDGSEGRLIGHGGLRRLEEFGETELLYALHPDMWGKGYASELGGFALKHAFDTVGLSLVFAITKPENLSSQGVMKRLGMTYRKNVIYNEIEAVWYDIDRATWQAEQTKK